MADKLSSGAKYGQDLSRVGSGLGRGANVKDKMVGAAWGGTWPAPGSTLDLDFVNNRGWVRGFGQGGVMDAITYTRASSGTWVGPDGLLKGSGGSAGALGKNLLSFPQDFDNAVWTKSTPVQPKADFSPIGDLTATRWTPAGLFHNVSQTTTRPTGTYTASIWMKTLSGARQVWLSSSLDGSYLKQTIVNVTDSWQRFTYTFVHDNTAYVIGLAVQDRASSGYVPIDIWGAQFELGDTATEYFPTNVNVPRFDWASTATLPQSNALSYSDVFTTPIWQNTNILLSSGNTILNQNSTRISDTVDSTAAYHGLSKSDAGDLTRSQGFVVRKGTARYVMVGANFSSNGVSTYRAVFDLESKSVVSTANVTASLTELAADVFILTIFNSYNGGDPSGRQISLMLMNGSSYSTNLQYQGNGDLYIDVLRAFSNINQGLSTLGYDQMVGSAVPSNTPLAANPTVNGLLIEESRTNRALWCRDATSGTGTNMIIASSTGVALTSTDNVIGVESDNLLINGDFSQGSSGWNLGTGWSVVDSQLVGNVTGFSGASQIIPLTLNACYKVTMTATVTSGLLGWGFGNSGQSIYFNTAISQSGTYTWYVFLPNGTNLNNGFYVRGNATSTGAFVGTVDNISVVAITSDNMLAPDNTYSAATAVASTTNAVFNQSVIMNSGLCTFSIWLRRKSGTGDVQISCDSVTGVWVTQSLTDTWTRYNITQTPSPTTIYPGIRITTQGDEVEVWGPQIVPGSVLTDYQSTANAPTFGWSKSSVTVTKDQTGIDGVANAATSITASIDNAVLIQPVSLTSGSRTNSVYLKRLNGTGVVQCTLDGSTWSTVDLSTTEWRRVVLSGTVTNPCVGVRLATSGDSIAMDYAQIEDGITVTTPILTTASSTSRSTDIATMSGHQFFGWWNGTEQTIYSEILRYSSNNTSDGIIFSYQTYNNNNSLLRHDLINTARNSRLDTYTPELKNLVVIVDTKTTVHRKALSSIKQGRTHFTLDGVAGVFGGGSANGAPNSQIVADRMSLSGYANGAGGGPRAIKRLIFYPKYVTESVGLAMTK